jgi:ribosome modulation factor
MAHDSKSMVVEHQGQAEKVSWAIRAAAWVGRSVGRWQKRRAALRDEEFVRQWQRAWVSGRDSRWGGAPEDAVPYRRAVQRQAWLAGWQWANTQPDRRNALRPDRRAQPRESVPRRLRRSGAHADSSAISDPPSSAS